ncbi:MAG: tetratricopeptide repeat protein [Candidatus Omnitrophica bacterium]|nr:tetratricopeptide repeat protein [Candidatus Omnitrophota bacterium]
MGYTFRKKIMWIICGILFALVVLEIVIRLGGFIFLSVQEFRNKLAISKKCTYRIMCLGESTTMVGGKYSYPIQFEEILNERNIGINFSVINRGVPRINSSYIVANLEDNLNKYKPNMVVTMMGSNDGSIEYYKDIPQAKSFIFNHIRTYAFLRTLWMHIENRMHQKGIYPLNTGMSNKPESNSRNVIEEERRILRYNDELKGSFKKAVRSAVGDVKTYMEEGSFEFEHNNLNEAEFSFRKAADLDPRNIWAYIGLAKCYRLQSKLSECEEILKKAIKIDPQNEWAYFELGLCYKDLENSSLAEAFFKQAIKLNQSEVDFYVELGILSGQEANWQQNEEMLQKALALNSNHLVANVELAYFYEQHGRCDLAEKLFKRALALDTNNAWTVVELGWCYILQKKYTEAENALKKIVLENQYNDKLYGSLALLYMYMGKYDLANKFHEKANMLRVQYCNQFTRQNYIKLKEILDRRGIKLVCVQYPLRNIEPLKKIFEDQDGIIFVDNEKVFIEAVAKNGYGEYFVDMFAGDFGHCTPKGSRLLAENISNVIIREYFRK